MLLFRLLREWPVLDISSALCSETTEGDAVGRPFTAVPRAPDAAGAVAIMGGCVWV